MPETYNIYCDESCHLEHDGHDVMVLGAVWCPTKRAREVAEAIRAIKTRHGLPGSQEIKWTKISGAKLDLYLDLVDYFFGENDLHFRGLVVHHKTELRHPDYFQDHDTWYYKMYFDTLKVILDPGCRYRIYLDQKDTRSAKKLAMLHEVLCNNLYDFRREIIERLQTVRSHEIEQVQLADVLAGALGYANRDLSTSVAKLAVVERIRQRSGYDLRGTTLLREGKMNIFQWEPRRA